MLGFGYILNAPVLGLDTHLSDLPCLQHLTTKSMDWWITSLPSLFWNLSLGVVLAAQKVGILEGGGDKSLCHRLEGSLQDKFSV